MRIEIELDEYIFITANKTNNISSIPLINKWIFFRILYCLYKTHYLYFKPHIRPYILSNTQTTINLPISCGLRTRTFVLTAVLTYAGRTDDGRGPTSRRNPSERICPYIASHIGVQWVRRAPTRMILGLIKFIYI